jgi:putative FmdB family regulatory protein
MPLYDFACPECENRFEARVDPDLCPPCPACGAARTERVYTAFAGPFTIRPRGVAAKRADATRRTREELRRERREQRRSEPDKG